MIVTLRGMHRTAVIFVALCCCHFLDTVYSFCPNSFKNEYFTINNRRSIKAALNPKIGMVDFSAGIDNRISSFLQGTKDDDDNDSDENDDNASWMKNAMNLDPKDMEQQEQMEASSSKTKTTPLRSGIAGFTVDPKLGFVCIFAPDDNPKDQYTYAIVSPTDADKLSSPEALSLVQLSGGLDLGAAVFPPESLAKIVGNEMILNQVDNADDADADADDSERGIEEIVEELRSKVTLLGVTALPNERYSPPSSTDDSSTSMDNERKQIESTPERNAQIEEASPKVLPAIQNLPGLTTVTLEQISQAMQIHADAKGDLGRDDFSELLDTLRTGRNGGIGDGRNRIEDQRIKMSITASVELSDDNDGENSLRLVEVDHVPVFQAVALALRYKVTVSVSDNCFKLDNDNDESENAKYGEFVSVLERFPEFKPVQELAEDARVMDGFLSTMFFKKAAPENDDKV